MGYDHAIVGGGIVGLATAMSLAAEHRRRVVVLEAEERLAAHQTGNNSGVIHSGLYYKPGSLKARLCAEGRELLRRFCDEQGVPHERCGKVVVAVSEGERPALEELRRRGEANGLAGMTILDMAAVRAHEPHVAGVAGLYVRETGIVDYRRLAEAYARVIVAHGGEIRTGFRVTSVRCSADAVSVRSPAGEVTAGSLVSCAGLQCDRVARMCGIEPGLRIVPFRGEYYRLAPEAWGLVRNLIYPVPDPSFPFLGVHFTRMARGGVEAGPNAVLALSRHGYRWSDASLRDLVDTLGYSGFHRLAGRYWRTGMGEIWRSLSKRAFLRALQRLLPAIEERHLLPGGAGVRAQALAADGSMVDDFAIRTAPRMLHVLNAPSPGATASIAIGRHIAQMAARM